MFCHKCGIENNDTDKFCSSCGTQLQKDIKREEDESKATTSTVAKVQKTKSTKQICVACGGKGKVTSLRFILSILVAFLVIPPIGLYFGTLLAAPFAMLAVISWGNKGRKCKVCGGTGMITFRQ